MQVTMLESEAQLAAIPVEIDRDRPDAHVMVTDGGRLMARCSCWWAPGAPDPIGVIGHYAALDPYAGLETIRRACDRLAAAGCTKVLGPMDGNTWRRYRFIVDRGPEPAFFLEPENADDWPDHFVGAGFRPVETYVSAVTEDLARPAEGASDDEARLLECGISLRPLSKERLDRDLHGLYTVSLDAFAENVAYSSIGEEQFLGLYRSVLPFVRPELVTIAEFDRQPIGFLFAIPDALEAKRTGSNRTVVLKTMAVLPRWRGMGLGRHLFARTHAIARQLGYTRAIHALMHETNQSRAMSARSARPFRRYALFGREL